MSDQIDIFDVLLIYWYYKFPYFWFLQFVWFFLTIHCNISLSSIYQETSKGKNQIWLYFCLLGSSFWYFGGIMIVIYGHCCPFHDHLWEIKDVRCNWSIRYISQQWLYYLLYDQRSTHNVKYMIYFYQLHFIYFYVYWISIV